MKLQNLEEWINETHTENENLDVFLQIVRLLLETKKGQGAISPALYKVDEFNDVVFCEKSELDKLDNFDNLDTEEEVEDVVEDVSGTLTALEQLFSPPEARNGDYNPEKGDVFSLGLLLYYLFHKEVYPVVRNNSGFHNPFSKKRAGMGSAIVAPDSAKHSILIQRMTAYEPNARPFLREVLSSLINGVCKFSIVRENVLSGERYREITRCFSESSTYNFVPEKEYVVDLVTVSPLSDEPVVIPFRLITKQYILKVNYCGQGRWSYAEKKVEVSDLAVTSASNAEINGVNPVMAALYFCDAVYGIDGDALFCETDGLTYEMGFYKYKRKDDDKKISVVKSGAIAVPERLEARVLSILREASIKVYDLFCVVIYGETGPAVIKTINDMFPEAVRIYRLEQDDIIKGAQLYLDSKKSKQESSVLSDGQIPMSGKDINKDKGKEINKDIDKENKPYKSNDNEVLV